MSDQLFNDFSSVNSVDKDIGDSVFAQEFQCDYFCESSCLFYLSLNSDFHVSKIMHL